ncbi:Eco57I restriction-modification methylase domain-containing protein, partial [Helicobacter bilis]|uniref:Eco57I restriction-modification methylase domain-containing protein n=1 Tax=Helicobacter bilis TaxID=37372 RepID=UPI0029435C1C
GFVEKELITLIESMREYENFTQDTNAFEWRFAFPEVLDSNGDFLGFDLVIGNPPYMQVPKGLYDKTRFPYSEGKDKGKQNLYKVFVELGYNLGHTNSLVAFITQSSIMCDLSAQFTRELLLKETQMQYFVEFKKNQKLFTGVIQGVCIMEFLKAKPKSNNHFKIAINNTESKMDKINFESISQQQILEFFPLYEIPLIKKGEMPIIAKVKTDKILLKDMIDSSLQGNINTIHLKKIQSSSTTDIKIYKGAFCHRWYLDKEVFYGIDKEITRKIIEANQNQYIITTQNITGTTDRYRIHANFVESKNTKIVFLDSCNITYCKNARDAKFLVGILNSKLLNWLFRITSTNNHVNIYELENLPIPQITESNKPLCDEIIKCVDKILESKAKDSTLDTSKLESQIDSLVYKLYNLTNDEIAIIDSKT